MIIPDLLLTNHIVLAKVISALREEHGLKFAVDVFMTIIVKIGVIV
jgi:hypothetical protein